MVSVIIPTYQREEIIRRTIKSVADQTYQNVEIIVVDDCSEDDTGKVVKEMIATDERIKYIRHDTNGGPAKARNTGLQYAKGKFIAFLDSDDIWLPEKLEKQINLLLKYPDIDVIFTDAILTDGLIEKSLSEVNNKFLDTLNLVSMESDQNFLGLEGRIQQALYEKFFISISTVLMRQKAVINISGFNPDLFGTEDIDFFIRLAPFARFGFLDEPMIIKENRVDSISYGGEKRLLELLKYHKLCLEFPEYREIWDLVPQKISDTYLGLITNAGLSKMPRKAKEYFSESKNYPLSFKHRLFYYVSFFGPVPIKIIRNLYLKKIGFHS